MIDLKDTKINCVKEDGSIDHELIELYEAECAKQGVTEAAGRGEERGYLFCINIFSPQHTVDYMAASGRGLDYFNDSELTEVTKAELIEKPWPLKPTARATYEKVNKNAEGGAYWECARDFAELPCNSIVARTNPEECDVMSWMNIKDNDELLSQYKQGRLYRKVEITPMQAAKNAIMEFCHYSDVQVKSEFDIAVDTDWQGIQSVTKGKEKLSLYDVDVDKLISMCRATVEAYDGVK